MATTLKYVGPFADGVEIAETGQHVEQNGKVEVADSDLAKRLLDQPSNWEKVTPKGGK